MASPLQTNASVLFVGNSMSSTIRQQLVNALSIRHIDDVTLGSNTISQINAQYYDFILIDMHHDLYSVLDIRRHSIALAHAIAQRTPTLLAIKRRLAPHVVTCKQISFREITVSPLTSNELAIFTVSRNTYGRHCAQLRQQQGETLTQLPLT